MTGRARTEPLPPLKVFRLLAGTTLIDLPFDPPPGASVRVATLWRHAASPTGWANHQWTPGPAGRGFVPAATELGDVIGFAADLPPEPPQLGRGRHRRTGRPAQPPEPPTRSSIYWYGYLHAVTEVSVVLRGPYPTPDATYAAAQRVLFSAITADHTPGPVPTEPAQPPVEVTVTWHGETAVVGDPDHGWLHAGREAFTAALTQPSGRLAAMVDDHVELTGREPVATLAALVAVHTPDQLVDITRTPPAAPSPELADAGPALPDDPDGPDHPGRADDPDSRTTASPRIEPAADGPEVPLP